MIIMRIQLEEMPFDRNGMHATGYEVQFEDGSWWVEYIDEDGECHYGR